jgi:hypothetical protein
MREHAVQLERQMGERYERYEKCVKAVDEASANHTSPEQLAMDQKARIGCRDLFGKP